MGNSPPLGRKEKANRDNNLTEEIFINYSYQNCKLGDTKTYPSHPSLVYLLSLKLGPIIVDRTECKIAITPTYP